MATIEETSFTRRTGDDGTWECKLLLNITLDNKSTIRDRRMTIEGDLLVVNLDRADGKETFFNDYPAVVYRDEVPSGPKAAIKVNVVSHDGKVIVDYGPVFIKDAEPE